VHEHYWKQLAESDRVETAHRAGCICLPERDSLAIRLLNREYVVDVRASQVYDTTDASSPRPAVYLPQLCILAYLVNARDLPLAGKLVSAEKLDSGGFFFRGSHRLPVEKLANVFGQDVQLLHRTGRQFDAAPQAFGDAAIELFVLPRIPLTLIVWLADEEFSARASILFDQTAALHLPLDVLYAAAVLTINSVVTDCQKTT
jgi:hypothetical protein